MTLTFEYNYISDFAVVVLCKMLSRTRECECFCSAQALHEDLTSTNIVSLNICDERTLTLLFNGLINPFSGLSHTISIVNSETRCI